MRGYEHACQLAHLTEHSSMCNMCHMKTISLRELHNNTGKWVRSVRDEEEIIVTDRGEEIATIVPRKSQPKKYVDWENRKLVPGYAKYLKEGKMGSDSTEWISRERTSRENSTVGIYDDLS